MDRRCSRSSWKIRIEQFGNAWLILPTTFITLRKISIALIGYGKKIKDSHWLRQERSFCFMHWFLAAIFHRVKPSMVLIALICPQKKTKDSHWEKRMHIAVVFDNYLFTVIPKRSPLLLPLQLYHCKDLQVDYCLLLLLQINTGMARSTHNFHRDLLSASGQRFFLG